LFLGATSREPQIFRAACFKTTVYGLSSPGDQLPQNWRHGSGGSVAKAVIRRRRGGVDEDAQVAEAEATAGTDGKVHDNAGYRALRSARTARSSRSVSDQSAVISSPSDELTQPRSTPVGRCGHPIPHRRAAPRDAKPAAPDRCTNDGPHPARTVQHRSVRESAPLTTTVAPQRVAVDVGLLHRVRRLRVVVWELLRWETRSLLMSMTAAVSTSFQECCARCRTYEPLRCQRFGCWRTPQ